MPLNATAQPLTIDPQIAVISIHVIDAAGSTEFGRFPHFHDAAELMWFPQVQGRVVTETGEIELRDRSAIFVPAMQYHDFQYDSTDKEMFIVHITPQLMTTFRDLPFFSSLDAPICVRFDPRNAARLTTLCEWLSDQWQSQSEAAMKSEIVKLMLNMLSESNAVVEPKPQKLETNIARIRPALDAVARDPAAPHRLGKAASMCHLSPTYFSRLFKRIMGMNFSEYVLFFRLRLAARALATKNDRISDLSYALGFSSPAHFSTAFATRFGCSPSDFRRSALRWKQAGGLEAAHRSDPSGQSLFSDET